LSGVQAAALDAWAAAFPKPVGVPFELAPYGPGVVDGLYTVAALYDRLDADDPATWEQSYDYAAYAWFIDEATGKPRWLHRAERIAAHIHDANISAAIDRHLCELPAKVVGFMGGHEVPRASPAFRQTALMARRLRRKGLQIVTGGGPGLMEAANFGAFLAAYDDDELDRCLDLLKTAEFKASTPRWLQTACRVRQQLLGGDWKAQPRPASRNLGIPTWLYGHEPPNVFATAIGKYFHNSVREDGLVSVASGGLVFGPGAAGTVQEIFQNVTLNYYRVAGARPTPMVFAGKDFWDPDGCGAAAEADPARKPAFPLVRKMGVDGDFTEALLLSDDIDEMVRFLVAEDISEPGAVTLAEARRATRAAAQETEPG
jgi:predicted Rossmann-fold nucleotide-binding protein